MARIVHTILLAGIVAVAGCGTSEQITSPSAEERFQRGLKLYEDEDYLEAINEFTVITHQHQGSVVGDDAQFYLGECQFQRGDYRTAAFEYEMLKRNMPASPFVPEAQYKLGLCYYMLSPKSSLDQQDTFRAIEELQTFVELYRENPHASDAEKKIDELNLRLAKKAYDNARLYATMGEYRSATIYFDGVIEKYHDTEYAPLSYLGKAEALISRKRFQEALATVSRFLFLFPDSVLRARAEKMKQEIENALENQAQEAGESRDARVLQGSVF
jgi:outer membrane protein assembly factor BamD